LVLLADKRRVGRAEESRDLGRKKEACLYIYIKARREHFVRGCAGLMRQGRGKNVPVEQWRECLQSKSQGAELAHGCWSFWGKIRLEIRVSPCHHTLHTRYQRARSASWAGELMACATKPTKRCCNELRLMRQVYDAAGVVLVRYLGRTGDLPAGWLLRLFQGCVRCSAVRRPVQSCGGGEPTAQPKQGRARRRYREEHRCFWPETAALTPEYLVPRK
jgi:hypothetical protein